MIRFLILLAIASLCGSIGAKIAGAKTTGCLTSIALGFVGALIGGYISRKMAIPDLIVFQGIPLVWSIVGAAIFVAIINMISGGSRR